MYGIEVGSGENDALIIAAAICNDEMAGHQPAEARLLIERQQRCPRAPATQPCAGCGALCRTRFT